MISNQFVTEIKSEEEFENIVSNTAKVIIDWSAKWCGPCKAIAPLYSKLAEECPNVKFLKVDVDDNSTLAQKAKISAMPTFYFFENSIKCDEFKGGNAAVLEEKVRKFAEGAGDAAVSDGMDDIEIDGGKFKSLFSQIKLGSVEVLNENETKHDGLFQKNESFVESDCDPELLVHIPFTKTVQIHSILIEAPKQNGPKSCKLYVDKGFMNFEDVADEPSTFEINLEPTDYGSLIPLRFVKFQRVNTLSLFFEDNQEDEETTAIAQISLFGTVKLLDFAM